MIRRIAALFREEFGDDAMVARTGGDEFAVLVPMDERTASTRARRVLAAIEGLRVAWQGQNLGTTGSIGIATSQAPHLAFDELLSQAEAACFTAKASIFEVMWSTVPKLSMRSVNVSDGVTWLQFVSSLPI